MGFNSGFKGLKEINFSTRQRKAAKLCYRAELALKAQHICHAPSWGVKFWLRHCKYCSQNTSYFELTFCTKNALHLFSFERDKTAFSEMSVNFYHITWSDIHSCMI